VAVERTGLEHADDAAVSDPLAGNVGQSGAVRAAPGESNVKLSSRS
jgi:hypothetical protein